MSLNFKRPRSIRFEQFQNEPDNPQQLPLIIDEIKARAGNLKGHIFEIGKLLFEAKKLVGHGKFKKWIEDHFEFSYQTANNFMNVYDNCLHLRPLVKLLDLSVLYQIASPKCPDDLRDLLIKAGEGLKGISGPKIKSIINRFIEKEIDLKSPEIQGLIKYREDNYEYGKYTRLIDRYIIQLTDLRDNILKKTEKISWPINLEAGAVEMTEEQIESVNDLIKEMVDAITGIIPGEGLVKKIRPNLGATINQIGTAPPTGPPDP
jgi:hypothetical protein